LQFSTNPATVHFAESGWYNSRPFTKQFRKTQA
jgi:hypothetical protein